MAIKSKKIIFDPHTNKAANYGDYPRPATKFVPDWYKKIPGFMNDDKKLKFPLGYSVPNITIKKCIPFLDAITIGYMICLNEDILVEILDDGSSSLRWKTNDNLVSYHSPEQYPGLDIPDEYQYHVFKWSNDWTTITPKGYSILFTHPINRVDLPFFTFSGYVNSDNYNLPVNFPFIMKKNFEGIIPAGTPISQLVLIKHESWRSDIKPFDSNLQEKRFKDYFSTLVGSYKKKFWHRHSYK